MTDVRPSLAPALAIFGLPATVTVPGEAPVATTAIWLPPAPIYVDGVLTRTNNPQPVLALPRADVPIIPRGTLIEVARYAGGPVRSWIVESIESGNEPGEPHPDDDIRVVVIPGASA
jgi:hypothetical protein